MSRVQRTTVLTGGHLIPEVPCWVHQTPSPCCGEPLRRIQYWDDLRMWMGACEGCGSSRILQPEDRETSPPRERRDP